jgi:hypothetical protein
MKQIAYFLLAALLFTACEPGPKPNEPFYCKIDGKKFRPDNGGDTFLEPLLAERDGENNNFYIIVIGKNGRGLSFGRKFPSLKEFTPKRYDVNDEFRANHSGDYVITNGRNNREEFEAFENSGYIEFTKVDTVSQRVSGTFEFKVKSKLTGKVIDVKDGCFNDVFFY